MSRGRARTWSWNQRQVILTIGIFSVLVLFMLFGASTSDGALLRSYYRDIDGDGYGDHENDIQSYVPPSGYVKNNSDCDDNNPSLNKGACKPNKWKQVPLHTANQRSTGFTDHSRQNTSDMSAGDSTSGKQMQVIMDISYLPSKPRTVYMSSDTSQVWKSIDGGTDACRQGGRSSVVFFNDADKMIFFLTEHGPVLTEDGGNTFKLLNPPVVGEGISALAGAVDPTNQQRIVTALGQGAAGLHILAVSENLGRTWRVIQGTEDCYIYIVFHPQKPNIIYAQGWKSEDSGQTWHRISKWEDQAAKVRALYPGDGDIVYAAASSGSDRSTILKSTNGGNSWNKIPADLPVKISTVQTIEVDPHNSDRIYVSAMAGIFIYENGQWVKKGANDGLAKDSFGGMLVQCMVIDPNHSEVIYAGHWAPGTGHSGVFRSTDYGQTWKDITYNLLSPISGWSLAVSPHDGTVFFGSSHGTWILAPPYSVVCTDEDGDGYSQEGGDCGLIDCNDNLAGVHPGAVELCDGIDNDCSGQADKQVKNTYYRDADSDGYGNPANTIRACSVPVGYVTDNTDCVDTNANIHPGAIETCDGKDNNCNNWIDDGAKTVYYRDADLDGHGNFANTTLACSIPAGYVREDTDCDDTDAGIYPYAAEICDGVDNNCDGQVDENRKNTYYRDVDLDGYGNPANSIQACSAPAGYVIDNSDCDDTEAEVNPEATEICDNDIDENCDNQKDEKCPIDTLYVLGDYKTIQAAIDSANAGQTVLVDSGTYLECINFKGKAVTVRAKHGPKVTFIDGGSNGKVVTFNSNEKTDSVLDGFTIRNGLASVGGGIYCRNASPTINNCIVVNNKATRWNGGGIGLTRSSATISNCIISANSARGGSGIYCKYSPATITNCIISKNTATQRGGGGISLNNSSPVIVNCTISENSAESGGGISCTSLSLPKVVNSIFWGNVGKNGDNEISYSQDSSINITYSDVEGGWTGKGNIKVNPQFVNPAGDNYHLRISSPCIDAGTSIGAPSADIDSDIRPKGKGYDIGADEK